MGNTYFRFKEFTITQERSAMKVSTDSCLFGAWVARELSGRSIRVLDIGAGTGLLSLMIAQQTEGKVDAIEIDEEAADEARLNFQSSKWGQRLVVVNVPLQTYKCNEVYDLIICNPPFYENDLPSPNAARNVALHHSRLTLANLFAFAVPLLAGDGTLTILVAARRRKDVESLALVHRLVAVKSAAVRQTPAHDIFRMMYQFTLHPGPSDTEELITIKDEKGEYTPEFTHLLRNYYLRL